MNKILSFIYLHYSSLSMKPLVVFYSRTGVTKEVGESIKDVHIARFESKRDLRKVISALDQNGLKLIDILKGRPLSFEIKPRIVNEIKIGD